MAFEFIDDLLDKIKKPIYMTLVFIIYFSYLLAYFGVYYVNPEYIRLINFLAQSFVCFVLMYRFNPLRKNNILYKNDAVIIFASAIIIFVNLISNELIRLYKEKNIYLFNFIDYIKTFIYKEIKDAKNIQYV